MSNTGGCPRFPKRPVSLQAAGVAVILLTQDELVKAEAVRRDFEDAWAMYSEEPKLGEAPWTPETKKSGEESK